MITFIGSGTGSLKGAERTERRKPSAAASVSVASWKWARVPVLPILDGGGNEGELLGIYDLYIGLGAGAFEVECLGTSYKFQIDLFRGERVDEIH